MSEIETIDGVNIVKCTDCTDEIPCGDWILVHDGTKVIAFVECRFQGTRKLKTKQQVYLNTKENCIAQIQSLELQIPPHIQRIIERENQ